MRSEEHTSELQSRLHLVCRLLLEKKKKKALAIHKLVPVRFLRRYFEAALEIRNAQLRTALFRLRACSHHLHLQSAVDRSRRAVMLAAADIWSFVAVKSESWDSYRLMRIRFGVDSDTL